MGPAAATEVPKFTQYAANLMFTDLRDRLTIQNPAKPTFTFFLHDSETIPNIGTRPPAPQTTPPYGQGPYRGPPHLGVLPLALSVASDISATG